MNGIQKGQFQTLCNMFIKVHVTAGAKKESFIQKNESTFYITVKEPAKMNLANVRVRELVANHFSLSKKEVKIVNGHHSPSKILSIRDSD